MIIALAGKTNKSISVFDWGNTGTLSSTAISHLDWGCQGSLNGYGFNSSFAAGKYLPLFVNLTSPLSDTAIRSRTTQAKNADARGICFFNLPMSSYRLRRLTQQPRLSVKPLRTPERPTRKTMAINVLRKMRRNRL